MTQYPDKVNQKPYHCGNHSAYSFSFSTGYALLSLPMPGRQDSGHSSHQQRERVAKTKKEQTGIQINREHQVCVTNGIDNRIAAAEQLAYAYDRRCA